jgi:Tfp pilus assembly protein PilV
MKMAKNRDGLTVVEVIVALIILSVGVLAMLSTSMFATRTMTRGRMADMAAGHATRRMELLRASVCTSQANAADTLKRGGQNLVINSWTIATAGAHAASAGVTWKVKLVTTYMAESAKIRTVVGETEVSCLI